MTNEHSAKSYNAVIEKALLSAIQSGLQSPKCEKTGKHGVAGLCMLQGPTGIGKTSSLYRAGTDNLPPALEQIKKQNHQTIFITHRWNILHDVYNNVVNSKDTSNKPFKASIIYAQDENLISILTRKPLPHETHINKQELPDPFKNLNILGELLEFQKKDLLELIHTAQEIKNNAETLEFGTKNPRFFKQSQKETLHKELKSSCSKFEFMLLTHMETLENNYEDAKKKLNENSNTTNSHITELVKKTKKTLSDYRENKLIRRIFPGIAWKDDEQHLLIMTTQKLFSSFYDGQNKVRITSPKLQGHIIFIDEFDYQSDVLQQQLVQSQPIHEPAECLGQLIDEGPRTLKRMEEDKDEIVTAIRDKLSNLLGDLKEKLQQNHINLESARAFVIPLDKYKNNEKFTSQFLFRADHLVTSNPITMVQARHGFEIREKKYGEPQEEHSIDIESFLQIMEQYIHKFSQVLSKVSSEGESSIDIPQKVSKLLFDPANDYHPTHYSKTLPYLFLYTLPKSELEELNHIKHINLLANTQSNMDGFKSWLLKQNDHNTSLDRLRIKIRRAVLSTTPEALIVSLASRNLVFGLSATSYINRAVGHFDIYWVQNAIKYIAEARDPKTRKSDDYGDDFTQERKKWLKRPRPYIQSPRDKDFQTKIIEFVSNKKAKLRETDLDLTITSFNEKLTVQEKNEISNHLDSSFFNLSNAENTQASIDFRKNTLYKLINVLITAAVDKSDHRGQIAFVNSARYFNKWLTEAVAEKSRASVECLKPSETLKEKLYNDKRIAQFKDIFIPFTVHNKEIIVCLLNAECQKRLGFKEAYQAGFDAIFNTKGCVLIVTQVASATNGINLDYKTPNGERMDITSLYLLESRHFYFSAYSSSDSNVDEMAHAGYQLRNLDKLRRGSQITVKQQHNYISSIMLNNSQRISELNQLYKKTEDYIKNTAADIQQQVGRLERTWNKTRKISIEIDHCLAENLKRFRSSHLHHVRIMSDLNKKLLNKIYHDSKINLDNDLHELFTPQQSGKQVIDIIDKQLILKIRQSRKNPNNAKEIEKIWNEMGQAALRCDYLWIPKSSIFDLKTPLKDWACIEKPTDTSRQSNNLHNNTTNIYYNEKSWKFFNSNGNGRRAYKPENAYKCIRSHRAIIDWFNKKGLRVSMYPTSCDLEDRYIWHPHFFQRIVLGRLGEESIRALLHSQGIKTHTKLNSPEVLELYDFTIKDSLFRVDAKFWLSKSIDKADQEFISWVESGRNPSTAPMGLINKLKNIRKAEGQPIKLAILNLTSNEEDAKLLGFDENLVDALPSEADIVTLNGCLYAHKKETLTTGFKDFVKLVKKKVN